MNNVIELGAQDPSVESVVTRLYRHMDKIKHITAIVTWKEDGKTGMSERYSDSHTNGVAAHHLVIHLQDMLKD